jgi:acetyl esterase/lipase
LRHELNNETDRYMGMKETNSGHVAEVGRLRALITEWADADNAVTVAADARPFVRERYDVAIERCGRAYDALREEAGR